VANPDEMRLPALQVRQGPQRTLYSFAVEGKQLPLFTTVSRIRRNDDHEIEGYQRPEVLAHIAAIRRYIESDDPMVPNALVIAFDSRVRFEPAPVAEPSGISQWGTLVIPLAGGQADWEKPGWIVDGQQRAAAVREANVESFPVCVTAFITDDTAEQRAQFILVNSTKPLPKGLIHELLPATTTPLPVSLQTRRLPAYLLNRLNYDDGSPMEKLIQTPTTPQGKIKDNSVLRMLENSLSDGALYRYRDRSTGEGDTEAMLRLLKAFWSAVKKTFLNDGWDLPPRHSRLMHGVGIISLGFVMDAIADRYMRAGEPTHDDFAADLSSLKDVCRWTHGYWDFGPHARRKWNDLQNTPKDIQLLTNYLLVEYKARVWNRSRCDVMDI
jgi:DGQHR domain-containing protein